MSAVVFVSPEHTSQQIALPGVDSHPRIWFWLLDYTLALIAVLDCLPVQDLYPLLTLLLICPVCAAVHL